MDKIVTNDSQNHPSRDEVGGGSVPDGSAPLPPSVDFERYERAYPGSASRILDYMEREQAFRQKATYKNGWWAFFSEVLGQLFAFIVTLILVASATLCTLTGHEGVASVMFASVVLGVIKKFIDGRSSVSSQEKSDSQKESEVSK